MNRDENAVRNMINLVNHYLTDNKRIEEFERSYKLPKEKKESKKKKKSIKNKINMIRKNNVNKMVNIPSKNIIDDIKQSHRNLINV